MSGPFTAGVVVLLAMGLHLEGAALTRQLSAEAATGTGAVDPPEVAVLARPWRRFQARLRKFAQSGIRAYFRLARLQQAQLDLAMERWHRERNEIDEPLEAEDHLRQRVLALKAAVS
jgi:hypothetical protein